MTNPSILGTAKAGCFVCVTDRARAKAFYGETLGLTLKHEDGFATVLDSNDTTLRVSPAKRFRSASRRVGDLVSGSWYFRRLVQGPGRQYAERRATLT